MSDQPIPGLPRVTGEVIVTHPFPLDSCPTDEPHELSDCTVEVPEPVNVQAAIEGMARVEEFNDQFRQPNPNGKYPICKPKLYDAEHCERCGNWIKGIDGPCPAVPPDKRWGRGAA